MKNVYFSSVSHNDMGKLMAAKTADEFMKTFKAILQGLYYEDTFSKILRHPIADNFMAIFGMLYEPTFPTKGENVRFFPSIDVFNKLEKCFRTVERYQVLLEKQKTPCGMWKIKRKISKVELEMTAQEFYSAAIYLFLHKDLGKIEDFKSLLMKD